MRKRTTIFCALFALLFAGCTSLTGPTVDVDLQSYWGEAEYRINHWLSWHPQCPRNYVKPLIRGIYEANVPTCTYSPGSKTINVNPLYIDGCMAHELGHAALHQAGNKCWRDYEHDL
jgi:hypothetical protein